MLIILTTSLVMDGISILSLMAFVFYFDFTVLFVIQTHLVLKNRTAVDKGDLQGNFDIFKGKSKCENWQQVFTSNIISWFVPFKKPDILTALDYDANIQPGGLLGAEGSETPLVV